MNKIFLIFSILLIPSFCLSENKKPQLNPLKKYIQQTMNTAYAVTQSAIGLHCLGFGLNGWAELIAAKNRKIPTCPKDYAINAILVMSGFLNLVQGIKDLKN